MQCVGFPKMFNGNSTVIVSDEKNLATMECVHLLLHSEAGTLFGDPGFGIRLKRYTYNQNNYILRDILIDEIYTALVAFCPQLYLERKNITLESDGKAIYALIKCRNQQTFETNTFNLVLYQLEENE